MVTFSSNHFDNKTPRLFKQLWTSLNFEDVTLATLDEKQITNKKVCTIGIRQDREEISCNICDPVVYKEEFELKENEHAIYEGLISEYNESDCDDTPVDLDEILESTDLTHVEWSFNRVFWDNHRVVSDLEADRQRRKDQGVIEDIMKTKEITKVVENVDADNEGVIEKVKVTEIKFASTDIRYRKQQGPVDSGKNRKPLSIKYIDEDKERTDIMEKIQVTDIKFASTDIRYRKQQGLVNSGSDKKPPSKYKRSHNQYKTKKQNVK